MSRFTKIKISRKVFSIVLSLGCLTGSTYSFAQPLNEIKNTSPAQATKPISVSITIPVKSEKIKPIPLKTAKASKKHSVSTTIHSVFVLKKGDLVLVDLRKWAKQAHWVIVQHVNEDWEVPNTTSYTGTFRQAVTKVIEDLAYNGVNIRAKFYLGNDTIVISGTGSGN